jgi:hypothetical protein
MPWDKAKKTKGKVLKEYVISNSIPSENIFVTKNIENTLDKEVIVKELTSPKKEYTCDISLSYV